MLFSFSTMELKSSWKGERYSWQKYRLFFWHKEGVMLFYLLVK